MAAVLVVALLVLPTGTATAADTGAMANGDWSSDATWTNGVPGAKDNAYIGSTYPTGCAQTATVTMSQNTSAGNVDLGYGSGTTGALDLNGFTLTANNLNLGQNGGAGSIQRTGGGTMSILNALNQNSGNLSFAPGDVVNTLYVSNNSTATTAAATNVRYYAFLDPGSTLSLGTDLTLTSIVQDPHSSASQVNLSTIAVGGTLNANGHAISAQAVSLGVNGGPFILNNRGPIVTTSLGVSSQFTPGQTTFSLTTADSVAGLGLIGVDTALPVGVGVKSLSLWRSDGPSAKAATVTTSTTSSVTDSASIGAGCVLSLGADLNLSSTLQLDGTLDANGHSISAPTVYVGRNGGPAAFRNDGLVMAQTWNQGGLSRVRLSQPGDALGTLLLSSNSALTIGDAASQTTGLTLTGGSWSSLSIAAGSDLMLEMNGQAGGWVFRWANPSGGDHIADLQSLIGQGRITFSSQNGGSYALSADSLYTYVNVVPVPEPSVLALSVAAAGLLAAVRHRRDKK